MLGKFFSWLSNPEKVAEFIADTTVCLLIFISIILIGKVLKLIMDSLKGFFKGKQKAQHRGRRGVRRVRRPDPHQRHVPHSLQRPRRNASLGPREVRQDLGLPFHAVS